MPESCFCAGVSFHRSPLSHVAACGVYCGSGADATNRASPAMISTCSAFLLRAARYAFNAEGFATFRG